MGGLFSRKETRGAGNASQHVSQRGKLPRVNVYSSLSGSYVFGNAGREPRRDYPAGSLISTPSQLSTEGSFISHGKTRRHAGDSVAVVYKASNERYLDVNSKSTTFKGCDSATVTLRENEVYAAPAVRSTAERSSTTCSVQPVTPKTQVSDNCRSVSINVASNGSYSTGTWSTTPSRFSMATNYVVDQASSGYGKVKGSVVDEDISSTFNKGFADLDVNSTGKSLDAYTMKLKSDEDNVARPVRSTAEKSYVTSSVKPKNYETDTFKTGIDISDNGSENSRVIVNYIADGGSRVVISVPLNPWQVLGLSSSKVSHADVNAAFKMNITQPVRQKRAMISIAYHMLTSSAGRYKRIHGTDKFVVGKRDHFMLAACGHTEELALMISKRGNLVQERDEQRRTLLYMACRSGFYDTCKLLLQKGASVNETQRDGSTPLHGAAYFGHELVAGLLLQYGARSDVKNKWGTPLEESATPKIRSLIQTASADDISSLAAKLREKQLVLSVRLIDYLGNVIAKELIRDPCTLDVHTRAEWNTIQNTWETAWHGTRYQYLQPIIEKGLLPAGSSGIKPAAGHYGLGEEHFGIPNWAAAIFVSPSILYAAHACYSERVFSESQQWCVLVKAYCKPGSYKSYDPTVFQYKPMDGEPDMPEYRVPVTEANKNVIMRVESTRSVVVQSLIFVRLSFLENQDINFEKAMALLC